MRGTNNVLFFSKRNMSLHFVVIIRYGTAEVKIKSKSLLKRGVWSFILRPRGAGRLGEISKRQRVGSWKLKVK